MVMICLSRVKALHEPVFAGCGRLSVFDRRLSMMTARTVYYPARYDRD